MKPKQILILGIILGILAAAVLTRHLLRARSGASITSGSAEIAASFDPETAERILISRGMQPAVELFKEAGTWKVRSLWNASADTRKVMALLRGMSALRGELRATGKALFPDFGIGDKEAFLLKCLGPADQVLLDLRVGIKRAGDGYFVRQSSGQGVFLVETDMASLLGVPAGLEEGVPLNDAWADLSLFRFDPEKVTKIMLYQMKGETKNRVLGLLKETDPSDPLKGSWSYLREGTPLTLDPEKVLKYVATLLSIQAQKVVTPEGQDYGLATPAWQLGVSEGNRKILLNIGAKAAKEELYYVKRVSDPVIFALSAGYFKDLIKDDTDFFVDVPEEAGVSKKS